MCKWCTTRYNVTLIFTNCFLRANVIKSWSKASLCSNPAALFGCGAQRRSLPANVATSHSIAFNQYSLHCKTINETNHICSSSLRGSLLFTGLQVDPCVSAGERMQVVYGIKWLPTCVIIFLTCSRCKVILQS